MRYDDWTIAEHHRNLVADALGDTMRRPHLALNIPGLQGNRLTDSVRAGVWMAPHASRITRQFSSTQDIRRDTLLLMVSGTSTTKADQTPDLMKAAEALRTAFAVKRALKLLGELYTEMSQSDYQIDDGVRRKYDLMQFVISTTIREDR